ncbi:MAG: ribosome recycling factor [Firmicutes bacterium]|nr:ribosome recycling factor [Bacillota bacterium]
MVKEILKETENRMKAVIEATKKDLAAVRTGRANTALLDRVTVDYYGTPTPINQLANISAPEARLLVIQPWDKGVLKDVEKAILKSDLGLVPTNDGAVIRIAIPQLTEERRRELVKLVKKEAEEKRVAVRNIRRDTNEHIKAREKKGQVSEDDSRRGQEDIQKLTDKYIAEIDRLVEHKEKEILEV